MQSIVFAFKFCMFHIVIVKHWFVVNSFTDLHRMGPLWSCDVS